jgi:hypothetical protein
MQGRLGPAALIALLAACGSNDSSNPNPPRLWLDLSGPEIAGQVQLVPFQPAPF